VRLTLRQQFRVFYLWLCSLFFISALQMSQHWPLHPSIIRLWRL